MKTNIHPLYHEDVQVICACGNSFKTGSVKKSINTDVCYKCHPYYTGEHKLLDRRGRGEAFQKKQTEAKKYKAVLLEKKQKKLQKTERTSKSLRELLAE